MRPLTRRRGAEYLMPGMYQTVFEIGFRSFPWLDWLQPCVFVAIGLALYKFSQRQAVKAIGILGFACGVLFFLITSITLIPDFLKVRRAYASGRSSVIEGNVEAFHPMPTLGLASESFSINGTPFSYNVLEMSSCFHNGPPHKGPIHSDMTVRIFYSGNCIQRVDVPEFQRTGRCLDPGIQTRSSLK